MGFELPELTRRALDARFRELSPERLSTETLARLAAIYGELRRWNRRVALIGRGTGEVVLERHFGESLACLPLLARQGGILVDVGSGAGFPGLVLAATRPRWRVTLIESRERKWAFLEAAGRAAGLSCRCLNARVGSALPEGVPERLDVVTVRAVELEERWVAPLRPRMGRGARLLCWRGAKELPALEGFVAGRELPLSGSESRRIVELLRIGTGSE